MQQKPAVAPSQSGGASRPVRYVGVAGLPDGTRRISLGSGVITALLSRGGSAYVYEIWNSQLEVNRAVKLLHPDRLDETKERFETEVKITAKLHHPNIVEIYVVGNWNGLPYIEMEQVDGITLEQLIAKRGAIPVEVCTSIGIMVARALDYAHNQRYMIYGREYRGIIHRDLKPGNVMLSRDGRIKLMDFGIAKPVKASSDTSEGIVVGTMQYLSPEQLQGGAIDVRADLYSFGAVMYELLTGTRTFPERNLARLVTDKLSNRFQPLNKFKVAIPARLRNLIHRCLNYQKHKRVQNASELLRELELIHRTVTDQSAEEVLRSYVKYAEDTRTVLDTRWLTPHLPTIIQGMALATLLVGGTFLFLQIRAAINQDMSGAEPSTAQVERTVEPPPPPRPAAVEEPVQEEPIEWEMVAETPAETLLEADQPEDATDLYDEPERAWDDDPDRRPSPAPAPRTAKPRTAVATNLGRPASSAPAERAAPPKPPAREEPAAEGLYDRLSRKHSTTDMYALMEAELRAGHYSNVLELHAQAKPDVAGTTRGLIYKLRALQGSGNASALAGFMNTRDVRDAEFYIEKAMWLCDRGKPQEAQLFYERAMKTPGAYLSPVALEQRRMLCRARVATAAYDKNPSSSTKKEAMDSWYEIKLRLQAKPNHSMYRKADAEIRRIGAR
ncbi:MAG: protein kinase [Chitinivibrionales bacterium]|nr:protein kinase [Chitinivibrionales bacterium]